MKIPISVVVTVKNDPAGEKGLRDAIARQTRLPGEIIIIRAEEHGNCNRAVGRNIGIKKAKYNIIAVTDAGCVPHSDWLEKLYNQLESRVNESVVVAGFYRVTANSPFQQAIAPYLAVMPDQYHDRYLPASRSIAFTKSAWQLVGGYPEYADAAGEDLSFAAKLASHPRIALIQAPEALVDWEPPRTLVEYVGDIRHHTLGNFQTGYRPHIIRNLFVAVRWTVFIFVPMLFPVYVLWPLIKHYRHAPTFTARLLLPFVQLLTDAVVIVTIASWGLGKMSSKVSVG